MRRPAGPWGSRSFGGICVPTGTTADANHKRRAALARSKNACTKRERCVPLSLVVLDRLFAIEADNNTDHSDAHTEETLLLHAGERNNSDARALCTAQ